MLCIECLGSHVPEGGECCFCGTTWGDMVDSVEFDEDIDHDAVDLQLTFEDQVYKGRHAGLM